MDFEEFKEQVKAKVSMELGAEVQVKTVPKNNGVKLSGLTVRKDNSNIAPVVYLDSCFEEYQNGKDIESIAEGICSGINSNGFKHTASLSGFLEYGTAKQKIVFRLVNYGKNRERLEEIPHRKFLDLAVVYYYHLSEEPFNGQAAVQINNSHMEGWEVTEEELYRTALENTPVLLPCSIRSMESHMIEALKERIANAGDGEITKLCIQFVLSELTKNPISGIPMYVLTNRDILMGAACILYPGVLREFANKTGSDLYILPSSVHESIIVPAGEATAPEELKKIVTEINVEQVKRVEQLSDNVYIYVRATDTITTA